jgi:lipoprotein-releasing system ATP-binding protein
MNKKTSNLITLNTLCYAYEAQSETISVLDNACATFQEQQHIGLMGPSGVGKSTLLNIIGLIDVPQSGKIEWNIDGKKVQTQNLHNKKRTLFRGKNIGFIHQNHYLLHEFTALENIMIPQIIVGTPKNKARERAWDLLTQMDMDDRAHHRPGQLSGGQKQRVSIARALANQPRLVLADEPTGNLDEKMACTIFDLFQQLCHTHKTCMIMATHDSSFEKKFDKVLYLKKGTLLKKD